MTTSLRSRHRPQQGRTGVRFVLPNAASTRHDGPDTHSRTLVLQRRAPRAVRAGGEHGRRQRARMSFNAARLSWRRGVGVTGEPAGDPPHGRGRGRRPGDGELTESVQTRGWHLEVLLGAARPYRRPGYAIPGPDTRASRALASSVAASPGSSATTAPGARRPLRQAHHSAATVGLRTLQPVSRVTRPNTPKGDCPPLLCMTRAYNSRCSGGDCTDKRPQWDCLTVSAGSRNGAALSRVMQLCEGRGRSGRAEFDDDAVARRF